MALRSKLLDLLCPRTCPMCGAYVEEVKGERQKAKVICDACLQDLPRTEQASIRQNSTEYVVAGEEKDFVRRMRVMHLDKAAAFLHYEKDHPIQRVVHKMKYADQPLIGYQLGQQAAIEFQYAGFFDAIDVLVPIPLHPQRMRERGYNQSEYIAKGLSEITGIPIDTTHVTRIRNTPQQALQTGDERHHNVADAFAVNHPEQLYGQHILVVDDLITTGETMRSCLKAMKKIRGATFSVFALCKAR